MKKLLSIVLAVAMMSVMVFSASAADIDVLAQCGEGKIYANDATYATMTANEDGSYEVVVTKDASADYSTAYGLAIEPFMSNVDLTKTPYLQVELTCDAPFRITLLDRGPSGDKWISFGSEFFNTFVAEGSEAPSEAPANNFFPAGTYDCYAFFAGYYTWQANNGGTGFDPAAANITAMYIELKEAGTLKLSKMTLSETETGEADGDDANTGTEDDSTEPPKTGDVSESIVFAAAMIAAGAVVMMTVIATKKAKSR
ncbi:MAG: hypothetical protein IKV35_00960 [Clostridia bacterium]|nr:hypothetical protein [Clostridia bacterium]